MRAQHNCENVWECEHVNVRMHAGGRRVAPRRGRFVGVVGNILESNIDVSQSVGKGLLTAGAIIRKRILGKGLSS